MFSFSPNVAVNVRNFERAVSFYQEVLGIRLVNPHPTEECGVEMQAGPLTLWMDGCSKEEETQVGKVFFEFKTDNLAEALNLLEANGCELGRETKTSELRGRMVTDPFGMRFHVYEKL